MQELLTFRQVFVLLNDELRQLFNADQEDLSDEEVAQLKVLMEFFGLEKCAPGLDSWDSYEGLADELGDDLLMEYEDYVVSDLSHYELAEGDL
jgi:hypothetical protein